MLRSGLCDEASPAWKGRPFARAAQGDIAKFLSSGAKNLNSPREILRSAQNDSLPPLFDSIMWQDRRALILSDLARQPQHLSDRRKFEIVEQLIKPLKRLVEIHIMAKALGEG